jgi:VWFA-related protein
MGQFLVHFSKKANMKNFRTLSVAALVFVAHLSFLGITTHSSADDATVFEKTLSQKFNWIALENANGRTEVETWNSNRVRITATRQPGKFYERPVESCLRFQITTTDLRIVVRSETSESPIHLTVFVPRQVTLAVKGENEAIAIRGMTNALTVETEAGAISLALPKSANADLSLRAIEGSITSQLEMRVFGPVNAHSLDGRTGSGGSPVILRSVRGPVSLLADAPGRIAKADMRALSDVNQPDTNTIVNSSTSVSSDAATTDSSPSAPTDAPSPPGRTSSLANSNGGSNQNDPPVADVIKIDSRLVNLNVRVTDGTGKLIPDLSQADFQIFEDNVEQQVVRFEPVSAPVSVVLLLDASGSTKERWKTIRKAAKTFIDTLNPNTRIAVAAFTRRFLVICDFSCDRKLMKERIDDTKNLQSGTAFYDAMWATMNLFKEAGAQRKAIVVLTDGVDNSISSEEYEPKHPFDELLVRIGQEEVTIYPIYFDTEFQVTVKSRGSDTHESYVIARQQLNKIADETGGTLFKADRAEDLDGVYQRVASELQTLYSVSYNPSDKNYNGNWRNVGVKVKRNSAHARTKRGFYAK